MENNEDILNRAVDALKNRSISEMPNDVLKQTAFRLWAAQNHGSNLWLRCTILALRGEWGVLNAATALV
jgi:hypothetical protein